VKFDPSVFPAHPDHGTLVVTLILVAGLGLLMVVAGARAWWAAHRLRRTGVHTEADVIAAGGDVDTHGRIFQRIVYRVPTSQGSPVDLLTVGPHLSRHQPGTRAPVVYPPDDPAHARADDPAGRLLPALPLLLAGVALLLLVALITIPNL
jgi:hypothetical protein